MLTALLMDDDIELFSSLSSLGNEIFSELFKVSPRISSGFWEFLCWWPMWILTPCSVVEVKSHLSQWKLLPADAVVEVTEAGTIEDCDTGCVKGGVITEAVDAEEDDGVEDTGSVVLAAWWWAARSRFFSFSVGQQWRGRQGGGAGGGEGK